MASIAYALQRIKTNPLEVLDRHTVERVCRQCGHEWRERGRIAGQGQIAGRVRILIPTQLNTLIGDVTGLLNGIAGQVSVQAGTGGSASTGINLGL